MSDLDFSDARSFDLLTDGTAPKVVGGFGIGDDLAGLGSGHRSGLNRVWPPVAPHRTATLPGLPPRTRYVSQPAEQKRARS
jgi:hypothetical protein